MRGGPAWSAAAPRYAAPKSLLHPEAPRREDPHLEERPRRRAQAGHRAVRRPQGLDGAAGRPRPRGGAEAPRSRARAHDGGRPPLRGHRQPGHGRRDHGALRRAAGPRGPRRAGAATPRSTCRRRCGGMPRRSGGRTASPIQIRVGLNSGEVVVRAIGSDLRMDYTAVGQTTHLAARMEQLATPGTILLTADTLRLAEGYVEVKPLGAGAGQGAGGAGRGLRADWGRARALAALRGRRGARPDPLRRAGRGAGAAPPGARRGPARGTARWSPLVGEPGVGKSRLVWEVTHSHRTHGLARPRGRLGLLRQGHAATCRSSTSSRATSRSRTGTSPARSARR